MASSTVPDPVPVIHLHHLISLKLSSANYLLWSQQVLVALSSFDLLGFIDGSSIAPPESTVVDGNITPNPDFASWRAKDTRILSVIFSTLTEESMAEVVGCKSSRSAWVALEAAFSHSSASRANQLREELLFLRRGDMSVSDFGRKFKAICDQLAAIGRPVDERDKAHWFLRGLGSQFSGFADTRMAISPMPSFHDLLHQAQHR